MIKILHILNTNTFSGAENVVCQIINMFNNDSEIAMEYCSPKGEIESTLREKGISYIPVKEISRSEIARVIRENTPDIIHAHDIRAAVVASVCHKNIKLLCTIHGNDVRMRKFSWKSLSSILMLKEAKHIFWVSHSCLNEYVFRELARKKSSILPNVIDKEELMEKINKDRRDYRFDVVYLGRISKEKNPNRLINVLEIACHNNSNLCVAIVGDGPLLSEVRKEIKEKGLEKNIECLGFMENPMKLLSQAKLLIMTSDWEGTPMCVLEAMALGVPIVSTPTDGIVDLIQNDVTGFMSWDSVVLANKINEYIIDNEKRNELSRNVENVFDKINDLKKYKRQLLHYYF